jgi:hypothetical protein
MIAAALAAAACAGSFGPWKLDAALKDATWATANCGIAIHQGLAAVCGEDAGGARVVSVFRRNVSGNWSLFQRIEPRPGSEPARFGQGLSMNGNRLAIGSPVEDASVSTGESIGYVDVYAFGPHAGTFDFAYEQTREVFSTSGELGNPDFGSTLALDGDTLVVGARYKSGNTGKVYVFDLNTTDPPDELSDWTGLTDEHLGTTVDASDGRLAATKPVDCAGSPGAPSNCPSSVYVYHVGPGGDWVAQRLFSPYVPADPSVFYRDGFGRAMALGPSWIAVGDNQPPGTDPKIFIFRRSGETWTHDVTLETSGVSRYSLASAGNLLAIRDEGESVDTSAPVTRIRIYRIGATSVSFEGRINFPTLDAATRIDISNTTLITPEASTPPKALVFRHF